MERIFIMLLALGLAACNTVEGAKKDAAIGVEKTGEALHKGGEAVSGAVKKGGEAVGGALVKSGEAVQRAVE
ncbi:MAG: entericidin EcnAB [Betaproteobacteria bacterium]|nr:entericidin EcnAB [Betaproteobacteria bacterium]MCL2886909.1 entericidin EcnAB [Betaproteobacteria bacterium]